MENIFNTLEKTTNSEIELVDVKKNVEISFQFNEFEPMTIGQGWLLIFDFEKAIDIVRASGFSNIRLRQENNGGVMEWDNF